MRVVRRAPRWETASRMRTRRGLVVFAAAATIAIAGVTPAHADGPTRSTASADDPALAEMAIDVRPDQNVVDDAPQQFGPTTGNEVAITNAAAWQAAGIDGSGIKIGVIDFFDVTKYWNVNEEGPAPVAGVTAMCLNAGVDCTSEFFDNSSKPDDDHGVAVVE